MSIVTLGAVSAALLLLAPAARAQAYAPYSDFQDLTAAELASLQVKITYLGPVDHPIQSLMFTSTSGTVNVADFSAFRRNGLESEYGLDQMGPATFKIVPALLDAMIDSVATLPQVIDGGVDSSWYVSFAMVETVNGTRGFESILSGANGSALVAKILAAFSGQTVPTRLVSEAGCRMSLMLDNPPADITGGVAIKIGGFRRVRKTSEFVARIRITNTSGGTLAFPVTFLPRVVGQNVALIGEDGRTCAITPKGRPYINLPVGGSGLAPNVSVEIKLRISNPSLDRVRVQPQVFAGAGTR